MVFLHIQFHGRNFHQQIIRKTYLLAEHSYEGIRCATGEYRVYARQVQGGEWTPSTDERWKSMRGQSSVMVQHPFRLAHDGICLGPGVRQTVPEMVRELKSGNRSLYY